MDYTKYFTNCKAVFQGGGCKGVAYVGAYRAAYNHGVFFSELAGTSAGAIIAAFIAAGATPNQLERIVRSMDYESFLQPVKKQNVLSRLLIQTIGRLYKIDFLKKNSSSLSVSALKSAYGLFDSIAIENFVESHLYSISGKHNLTFNDIIPDLHIVCSDLKTHNVKIWNKKNTPNESIARAVRTSCSIPLFFTPTDKCYVDGGMLSNLPGYVFSDEPHYNKILCFRNAGNTRTSIHSFIEYILSLLGTIIDGAMSIQQQYVGEAYDVVIDTGDIQATDFERMKSKDTIESLLNAGDDAMTQFLSRESYYLLNSQGGYRSFFGTEEKMHSMVAELSLSKHDEIVVIRNNTYWAWVLFLSIVKWINDGTIVRVVVPQETPLGKYAKEESARRRMLKAMGCLVIEDDTESGVNGFFFKTSDIWTGVLCGTADNPFSAQFYKSLLESLLLKSVLSKYMGEAKENTPITIKQNKENDIIERIRTVVQYQDAKVYYSSVPLEQLVFLNPYIRALKYRQIQLMFDLYNNEDINMFSSTALVFQNNRESLVGPPVVELRGGQYFLIEGNTRCVYAYRHGYKELKMVVVEDVGEPLPCSEGVQYSISQVLLSDKKLEGESRYDGFDRQRFRHIEAAIRPIEKYML